MDEPHKGKCRGWVAPWSQDLPRAGDELGGVEGGEGVADPERGAGGDGGGYGAGQGLQSEEETLSEWMKLHKAGQMVLQAGDSLALFSLMFPSSPSLHHLPWPRGTHMLPQPGRQQGCLRRSVLG